MIPEPRVVDSGCNNRSKDDHSFLKSQDFLFLEIFSSRQFRRIVYLSEIIQNLCFFSNPEINFTKTCMHACKILQVLPKVKKSKSVQADHNPESHTGANPSKTRISQKSLSAVKNHCEPRAHARAPARTRTRGIYSNIIRRTSIYIFPKGKIYIY